MEGSISYEELLDRDGKFVYTVRGVSMMPLLRQRRDLIVIEKAGPECCKKYDTVLFVRPAADGRQDYVLHRVLKVYDDGRYWIVGDNCVSGDMVRRDQILGVMTSLVRDGRTIRVTDRGYRLYVTLWCKPYRLRIALLRLRNLAAGCRHRLRRFAARCRHRISGA